MTTQHERDRETGLDYRGARFYDSDIGRFLSLDPLAADYLAWSPYNYVLGNPARVVDPDGRSAEPVFDADKKQIVVNMHFNFYGNSESLNEDAVNNAISYLQTELNRHGSTAIGPDGNSYPVVFAVTGSLVSEKEAISLLKGNTGGNFDPKQNFVRVEDGVAPARNSSQKNLGFDSSGMQSGRNNSARGGDNSIYLAPEHLSTTTWVHEVTAHGLNGRGPSSHINIWADNPSSTIPSIMTHQFTRGVPSNLQTPNGRLDRSRREVLPQDKAINILWTSPSTGKIGGATNTYFKANGNEIIIK